MSYLRFEVPGTPMAQGSKRHVGNGVLIESSKGLKPWRAEIIAAAIEAASTSEEWYAELSPRPTYAAYLTFTFSRPKGHYSTGVKGGLKPSAPDYKASRPDLDKLVRAVFDALTHSGVIADDSQIVKLIGVKQYGSAYEIPNDRPGLGVTLERLT